MFSTQRHNNHNPKNYHLKCIKTLICSNLALISDFFDLRLCQNFLDKNNKKDFDKAAEDLRLATRHLGMIVGKVDVEEILGSIFNDFCIGK